MGTVEPLGNSDGLSGTILPPTSTPALRPATPRGFSCAAGDPHGSWADSTFTRAIRPDLVLPAPNYPETRQSDTILQMFALEGSSSTTLTRFRAPAS